MPRNALTTATSLTLATQAANRVQSNPLVGVAMLVA